MTDQTTIDRSLLRAAVTYANKQSQESFSEYQLGFAADAICGKPPQSTLIGQRWIADVRAFYQGGAAVAERKSAAGVAAPVESSSVLDESSLAEVIGQSLYGYFVPTSEHCKAAARAVMKIIRSSASEVCQSAPTKPDLDVSSFDALFVKYSTARRAEHKDNPRKSDGEHEPYDVFIRRGERAGLQAVLAEIEKIARLRTHGLLERFLTLVTRAPGVDFGYDHVDAAIISRDRLLTAIEGMIKEEGKLEPGTRQIFANMDAILPAAKAFCVAFNAYTGPIEGPGAGDCTKAHRELCAQIGIQAR